MFGKLAFSRIVAVDVSTVLSMKDSAPVDGAEVGASVLGRAKDDKTVGKTKVSALLKAVPGVGAVKAAALLEQAKIDPDKRAGGLGDKQRTALIDALA